MKISIDAARLGPIRVIGSFQVDPVSLLEGYNGIGKSAAVRVLQVCSGSRPYREGDRPWRSLSEALGPTSVTVSEIAGAHNITWQFDSRDWLDRTGPISTDWFRELLVDGSAASLDEVRSLFGVARIAGDEGVVETLAREADGYHDRLQRWVEALDGTVERPSVLAQSSGLILSALNVAKTVDIQVVSSDQRGLDDAIRDLESAQQAEKRLRERFRALSAAVDSVAALHELRSLGPVLDQQVATAAKELNEVQLERDRLIRDLDDVAGSARLGEGVEHDLHNAERTLARNQSKLQDATVRLAAALAPHGLEPDSGRIRRAVETATQELEELTSQQVRADTAPAVREMLGDLVRRLGRGIEAGLGSQRLIEDSQGPKTTAELRQAFVQREAALEGTPPPPEAATVRRARDATAHRLAALRELPDLLGAVNRHRRLVEDNQIRVTSLLASPDLQATKKLEALHQQREKLDQRALTLAAEQAKLVRQRGLLGQGQDELVLAAETGQQLESLGLEDEASLPEAVREASEAVEQASRELGACEARVRLVRQNAARHQRLLQDAYAQLSTAPQFAWVRERLVDGPLDRDADPTAALPRLAELTDALSDARGRLGAIRTQAIAVTRALEAVGNQLRSREPGAVEYVEQISRWLEDRFTDYFLSDAVRRELLPPGAQDIRVHLSTVSLSWSVDGHADSRPLDAFSSGEQALYYTRARLGLLDDETRGPVNRLICLDEFGAFMSSDRRDVLFEYLRDRTVERPNDRVLLILPVRQDYHTAAEAAAGSERARLSSIAEALDVNGFVTREVR